MVSEFPYSGDRRLRLETAIRLFTFTFTATSRRSNRLVLLDSDAGYKYFSNYELRLRPVTLQHGVGNSHHRE